MAGSALDDCGNEEPNPAAADALQSLMEDLEDMAPSGVQSGTPKQAPAGAVPLFDAEALDQLRSTIGAEAFQRLLNLVPKDSAKLLNYIQRAISAGDLPAARRYAHSLQGMAGNFAATRIAAVARELEVEVQTLDAARETSAHLERAIEETQQWIGATAS